MDENQKIELINEARMISVALPVLEPLLERRREQAVQRIIGAHNSNLPTLAATAELCAIESIRHELKAKLSNLKLEEKR